jgi:hypothetical protein
MKRLASFSFLIGWALIAQAQTPITWHLTFDPGADRTMDSLNGCWQIGPPDKTVFDSAYAAPNALVTDTVLPYPVGGVSYAEFSAPINFFGEEVQVSFRHRLEVDSGEAYGWVEYFDAGSTQSWVKTDPWQSWMGSFIEWTGDGLDTDSALIFTGTNNGWGEVLLSWRCLTVLQGPNDRASLPDSMRFRFAFQALANTNGRDGWMIDDLVVTNNGCLGGMEERSAMRLSVSPNPAGDRAVLELTDAPAGPMTLELFRADGAVVMRERLKGARHTLDLATFPDGPYVVRILGEQGQLVERLVVRR